VALPEFRCQTPLEMHQRDLAKSRHGCGPGSPAERTRRRTRTARRADFYVPGVDQGRAKKRFTAAQIVGFRPNRATGGGNYTAVIDLLMSCLNQGRNISDPKPRTVQGFVNAAAWTRTVLCSGICEATSNCVCRKSSGPPRSGATPCWARQTSRRSSSTPCNVAR
jgi:hypothetical protein